MLSFVERQMAINDSDLADCAGFLGGSENLGKSVSRVRNGLAVRTEATAMPNPNLLYRARAGTIALC
jgi:hypothetical protein